MNNQNIDASIVIKILRAKIDELTYENALLQALIEQNAPEPQPIGHVDDLARLAAERQAASEAPKEGE